MQTVEGIQNSANQGNISQEEVPVFRKIKQINVSMFDSETIISPPVANDVQELYATNKNFSGSNSLNQKARRSVFDNPIMIGVIGIFVFSSMIIMSAMLYNLQEQQTISMSESSKFPAEIQKSSENQPVLETLNNTEVSIETKSAENEIVQTGSIKNPSSTQSKNDNQGSIQEIPYTAQDDGNARAELNSSLDNWVSATNERNIEQQMVFYAPKVNSFYRARNTSINDVRDEKKRVFDGVDAVNIETGKPKIMVSGNGKTATMLFRKKYSIKKGEQNRNGEVLQEMKWVKTKNGLENCQRTRFKSN